MPLSVDPTSMASKYVFTHKCRMKYHNRFMLQMAFLQGKTPISFLQELCTKRGTTPQYDLIANEGAVHEPVFVFRVTAGDVIGTGKGQSSLMQMELFSHLHCLISFRNFF